MLEILLVIYLCKQIGNMLRDKGRSPGWYQALLVVLWFGGEIAGGVTGMLLTDSGPLAYLAALCGAGVGAGVTFYLAHQAAPTAPMAPRGFPVITQNSGHTGEL